MVYDSSLFVLLFEPKTKSRNSFKNSDIPKSIVECVHLHFISNENMNFKTWNLVSFHFQIYYIDFGDSMWFCM